MRRFILAGVKGSWPLYLPCLGNGTGKRDDCGERAMLYVLFLWNNGHYICRVWGDGSGTWDNCSSNGRSETWDVQLTNVRLR